MTFVPPSITGYNSAPPSDDGSQTTSNKVLWSTIKTKLADPVKNYVDSLNSATSDGFSSLFLNTLTTKAVDFIVATSEDGVFFNCTSAITATLPPAASAGDGFHIMVFNNSTGTVVVDGDDTETINGATTLSLLSRYDAVILVCTGSEWFAQTFVSLPSQTSKSGQLLTTNGTVPSWTPEFTGVVVPYAGATAPTNWLLCYGQAISRTTYAGLFAVIGTTFGSGDGSTTFNIPDMRGRVAAGVDNMGGAAANLITAGGSGITGTTLGATGGSQTHVLTAAQLASHTHTEQAATGGAAGLARSGANGVTGIVSTGIDTASAGSDQEHQNTQPTIMLNYIIRT